jgi:hypothetical protein
LFRKEEKTCSTKPKTKHFDFDEDTVNKVSLCGTVISCYSNDKATVMRIKALDKHGNLPKIIFFGDAKDIAKNFEKYDAVYIKGYVQSEKLDRSKEHQETSYVVGTAIEVMSEDDANSSNFAYKANRMVVKGKVVDVFDIGNLVKVNVKTCVNGHWNFVPMDYYVYDKNELTSLKYGDIIEANGYVQTSEKMLGDNLKHYQNFVIRHVKITSVDDKNLVA